MLQSMTAKSRTRLSDRTATICPAHLRHLFLNSNNLTQVHLELFCLKCLLQIPFYKLRKFSSISDLLRFFLFTFNLHEEH